MTIVDTAAARIGYHLVKNNDQWFTARPLLSIPGIRKLSDAEAAPLHDQWQDRVELGTRAQAEQAERMKASQERHEKSIQIKFLMDQLHREVTRIAKGTPEDTVFATIADDTGKVIGKIYQGGGLWFNSDEAWRVGGTAGLQRISDEAWRQTKDGKQARQIMADQFSALLGASSQASITLTGLAENPQPAFKADAPLLAIMDKISAIDPEFGSRFDDWRPDGDGGTIPQDRVSFGATPPKPGALPEGASRILTMSVDIEALKEKAAKTFVLIERQEALFKMREDLRMNDPSADAEAFFAQFRAKMEKVSEIGKRLAMAMSDVPPYAVIRDRQGKEVGRILQEGGLVINDNRNIGLLALIKGLPKEQDNKYGRVDAFAKGLSGGLTIQRTGVDIDPQTLFPELRKALQAARSELDSLVENRQRRLDAYHAAQREIIDLMA